MNKIQIIWYMHFEGTQMIEYETKINLENGQAYLLKIVAGMKHIFVFVSPQTLEQKIHQCCIFQIIHGRAQASCPAA